MKMSLPLFTRRLHLYLGLICLPWFLMYGITSIAFNHPTCFGKADPHWVEIGEWPCTLEVALDKEFPRELGPPLLEIAGIKSEAYGVYRWGKDPIVYVGFPSLWHPQRLAYHVEEKRLTLEKDSVALPKLLTALHGTGGFESKSPARTAWAVIVDLVCLAFLSWVVTGLYLWWRFSRLRAWGAVALAAGLLSFVAFMVFL